MDGVRGTPYIQMDLRVSRPIKFQDRWSITPFAEFFNVFNRNNPGANYVTAVVIGINGILPAVKLIETGALLASVDFNMFKIGCVATRAAVRHLKREPLPEKVILPAEIIDKTNYKAWLVPVDQRSCPEWADVVR